MTDEEKAIDVPGRQAKLAQILNGAQFDDVGKIAATVPMQISGPLPPVPRKRKTRSDAGTHKPRKPDQSRQGGLSEAQVENIRLLIDARDAAADAWKDAQDNLERAERAMDNYLDSLKA